MVVRSKKKEYSIRSKEDSPEYGYAIGEVIEDTDIDPKYCPFCNSEVVDKEDVLDFVIEKYTNKSFDNIVNEYKDYKTKLSNK